MKRVFWTITITTFALMVALPFTSLAQQGYPLSTKSGDHMVTEEGKIVLAKLDEASRLNEEGTNLLKSGKFDAAITSFSRSLVIYPPQSTPYIGLIEAYTAKGQDYDAIRAYRALVYPAPNKNWSGVNSSDTILLMNFALLLNRTGQRVEAIDVYAKGLANLNTKSDPALTTYFTTPNYNAAQFEAAARTAIGIKEYRSGHDDEALVELQKAVKVQPRFALAYFYLGRVLSDKKQTADSRGAFEKAATLGRGEVKTLAEKELKQ